MSWWMAGDFARLTGISLENDLRALRLVHDEVVDTAIVSDALLPPHCPRSRDRGRG